MSETRKPYKLRVDTIEKEHICFLCEHYSPGKWMWCIENACTTNPHSHFYLEMTKKTKIAMAKYIREKIGKGNRSYASAELEEYEPVEYLAYLSKQGDYEVCNIDLTNALAYDAKVKLEIKDKKKAKKTVFEECKTWIEQNIDDPKYTMRELYKPPYSNYEIPKDKSLTHYKYMVLLYYKEEAKLIRKFQIESIAQTIFIQKDGNLFSFFNE